MRRVQRQRVERVRKVEQFHAVDTTSPVSDPKKQARSLAQDSIASRFSIIQRGTLIFAAIIWVVALTFPLLGRIPSALVSILVGAGAVIIGIAVRPFLENMISGIVISFSKQLRTGDTVIIDETYGTVEDISLTHTVIKSWDWRRYMIPNSTMLTKEFLNFSIYDSYIWEHVEFWVDHEADISAVENIALQAAHENEFFSNYEPPRFWIMGMEKEAVKCWIAGWTDSPADAWLFKVEVRKRLMTEFSKVGIKSHAYRHDWPKNSGGSIMRSDAKQKES